MNKFFEDNFLTINDITTIREFWLVAILTPPKYEILRDSS